MLGLLFEKKKDFLYLCKPFVISKTISLNTLAEPNLALKEFTIQFTGLKEGVHNYNFAVEDDFFSHFQNNTINKSDLKVDLNLEKKSSFFVLSYDIAGAINAECDRCLAYIDFPLSTTYQAIIKYGSGEPIFEEDKTDIFYIPIDSVHINVAQLLYESIILALPTVKNCEGFTTDKTYCNEKVLDVLYKKEEKDETAIDPRWEALKKLKK